MEPLLGGQVDHVVAVRIGAHEVVGAAVARVHLDAVQHLGVGDDHLDAAVLRPGRTPTGADRGTTTRCSAVRVRRVDGRRGQPASDDAPSSFDTTMAPLMSSSSTRPSSLSTSIGADIPRTRTDARAVDRDRTVGGDRHREVDVAPRRDERRALGCRSSRTPSTTCIDTVGRLPAVAHLGDDRHGVAGVAVDGDRTVLVARPAGRDLVARRRSSAGCTPRGRGC